MDQEGINPPPPPNEPSPPSDPSVTQFNELFSGIRDYNRQFSMGALMAKALTSHLETTDIVSEDTDPQAQPSSKMAENMSSKDETAQEMQASVMDFVHQDALTSLGLELHPVSGEGATLVGEGMK